MTDLLTPETAVDAEPFNDDDLDAYLDAWSDAALAARAEVMDHADECRPELSWWTSRPS